MSELRVEVNEQEEVSAMFRLQFDPRMAFPELLRDERRVRYASKLYDRAWRTGRRKHFFARLIHRSRELLRLDDIRAGIRITNQHGAGTRAVAINRIRGTLGRSNDFDRDFFPTRERTEKRWVAVASALLRGETLPPVELIEVNGLYFVVDGHHRISVARTMACSHVDASVTVWRTV